jgi:peptidoglycan LD-endopeptidase LytH
MLAATTLTSGPSAEAATRAHVLPLVGAISYARTHHDYPAADIFPARGCGAQVVSPVAGRIVQIRRVDRWAKATDNPAWRGGKTIAIVGNDGVRYYLAHLGSIDAGIRQGLRVVPGQHLAKVGHTGRAGACHLHFALSIPCPKPEWSVRRGVVWPQPFLDAWKAGKDLGPAATLKAWSAAHPGACATASTMAHAGEA